MVGILAHLDVVPAGSGWSHPAYDLTEEKTGGFYGRGVSDDKGPAIACIYAMKDILDAGIFAQAPCPHHFGQSEESGEWDDMALATASTRSCRCSLHTGRGFSPRSMGEKAAAEL